MPTFSLLHRLLGFPYPSYFWTFKSRNLQAVKSLFGTLVPSMCYICQANNTSILLHSTFCRDTKLQKTLEFLLFFFCQVLGILCYLNKVANRVSISFLYLQRYWPFYPTKTLTISGVFEHLLGYILNSTYVIFQDFVYLSVKITRSRLSFFLFSYFLIFIFILILIYFHFFYFQNLGLGLVTRSCCHTAGHIR